jgi:hypothetical protein
MFGMRMPNLMKGLSVTFQTAFRRHAAGCLIVMSVAFGLIGAAEAQQRTAIAGTSVTLAAPPGFEPASGFAGLMHQKSRASILVVEMPPEAHPQVSRLFSDLEAAKSNFARQNVTVARLDQVTAAGESVPVISGVQNAGGMVFDKWVGLFKGPKTVMITVQAPPEAGLKRDTVLAMMSSVAFGKQPTQEEKLGALPFKVQAAAPFRVVDTIGGSGVLMTVGERNTDPEGIQPLLIVAYQLSVRETSEKIEALAEDLLRKTRDFQDATIASRERVSFAGANGVKLSGTFSRPGRPAKRFVQYIAIGGEQRFVRMLVTADEAAFPALEPAITQTAASIAFSGAK